LRRISVVVVSVLLMVVLAATMAALPTFAEENGNAGTNDGFGTAASQIATNKEDGKGGLGEHSSDPDQDGVKGEKREGIGNVAKDEPDTDGSVGEHGCKQLAAMGGDCSEGPGKGK
jgi:hypothetical protein